MTPGELSNTYNSIAKAHGLLPLKPALCHIQTQLLKGPDGILTLLQRHAPQQGWLQFQSHVLAFTAGDLPQPAPDWGVLLAAEAVDPNGCSIHLRQSGSGGWLFTVCTPAREATAETDTDLALADEVTLMATDKAPGPLHYRRYWQLDPETGAAPAFAAFIGFGPTEDD